MIIHEMPQRSDEWHAVRRGKVTATSFPTMANGRKATIETLCMKTATERITGAAEENGFVSEAMMAGIELEAKAREAYEDLKWAPVQEVGFLELDEYVGASPDGLVGDAGGVEIKCPQQHTHTRYWLSKDKAWGEHKWQIQGALWITGREWWDFISYCPVFPVGKRLLVVRVLPDKDCFAKLTAGAKHCRERIAAIEKGFSDGDTQSTECD